jgi:TATA-binding protein-associated factor Taf7
MRKDDPDFFNNLYRRGEIAKLQAAVLSQEYYKYRHGLSPATKNIRNIRFKKE